MDAYQRFVYSNPTSEFIEALAQDVMSANIRLQLPWRTPFAMIKALTLTAVENLDYEVQFFATTVNATGAILTEQFLANWLFTVIPAHAAGYPVTGDALFRAYVPGLEIPYVDIDQLGATTPHNAYLNVRIVNRNAVAKTAGAGGALQLGVHVAPMGFQP